MYCKLMLIFLAVIPARAAAVDPVLADQQQIVDQYKERRYEKEQLPERDLQEQQQRHQEQEEQQQQHQQEREEQHLQQPQPQQQHQQQNVDQYKKQQYEKEQLTERDLQEQQQRQQEQEEQHLQQPQPHQQQQQQENQHLQQPQQQQQQQPQQQHHHHHQQQQARQGRILQKFPFGNAGLGKTGILSMRNRLTNLIDKISQLERNRAKISSITKLQKIVRSFGGLCPPNTNSLQVGKKCYEHVTNQWLDYDSAFIYCHSRGGTLAQPHLQNGDYLKVLREYFPNLGDNGVLVGITDILQEGHFTFLDGTPAPPYKFHGGKYPTYPDKDCVALSSFRGFGLVNIDCRRGHEVLCEYPTINMLHFY